jgi:hypothetical protein
MSGGVGVAWGLEAMLQFEFPLDSIYASAQLSVWAMVSL